MSELRELSNELTERIEMEYQKRGDQLGWRLLYSPADTLTSADIVLLGTNPGGDIRPPDHAEFSMAKGSAYELERWKGCSPGMEALQQQVRALFRRLGVKADEVLAGNIVPFRSPSWEALPRKEEALQFGKDLWSDILRLKNRSLVITMGDLARNAVMELMVVRNSKHVPVNWGNITATKANFDGGTFVGLPHLSRFKIIERGQSQAALNELFAS